MAGEIIAIISFAVFIVCAMAGSIFGGSNDRRVTPTRT